MLESIWLTPPIAVARLGSSHTPCGNFEWGPTDDSPGGTGKTTLQPLESLELDEDGSPQLLPATEELLFKDRDADGTWRYRPVCPYFELHGQWSVNGATESGPVTKHVLDVLNIALAEVTWWVRLANLKAYQFTLSEGDRIHCEVSLGGDQTEKTALFATSPHGPENQRLIPDGEQIAVGAVQLAKLTDDFPELRLRFTPPTGLVYGPSDLLQRIENDPNPGEWRDFDLPGRLILNPDAAWPNYVTGDPVGPPFIPPSSGGFRDGRKTPGGIHAVFGSNQVSLGLVDDVTDGIIECSIGSLKTVARVAVGPPDFAPDRRHIVSIQDGLSDRTDRDTIRTLEELDELEDLVRDLFERALETSDAMNKDTELDRLHPADEPLGDRLRRSTGDRDELAIATIWPTRDQYAPTSHRADALPVSFAGRRKHRRYTALEYLRDRLREDPQLIDTWIRQPMDPLQAFDRRMPPLMRGSHGGPMNITRRQHDLLRRWVESLRSQGVI